MAPKDKTAPKASKAASTTTTTKKPSSKVVAKPVVEEVKPTSNPLFPSRPRNFRIGGDIRPKGRDLSRFVRWPKYIRLQRQKKILYERLKVPPAINQFNKTLDKNQAVELFKLLSKYQPETKQAKVERIEALAKATASGEAKPVSTPSIVLKYGLKHVTTLIEQKKAKLVVIANDVDPIELVIWLPALCRKFDIPFAIIRGKARLGVLTHKKTTSVVALTAVNPEDETKLKTLQDNFHTQFNENVERKWGGGIMGLKTQAMLEKRRIQFEKEEAKRVNTKK
mmetsp:Transcript_22857/g.20759  ORF Transcript_22857/g.20759 Transcript_22857/m.20759 type:complete len:281 (+) Transcript_22857:34-876(+)